MDVPLNFDYTDESNKDEDDGVHVMEVRTTIMEDLLGIFCSNTGWMRQWRLDNHDAWGVTKEILNGPIYGTIIPNFLGMLPLSCAQRV